MATPLQQFQPKTGEIALQDFRLGVLCRPFSLLFGKQMPADARFQTPGAACTLDHRRLADSLSHQPRQTIAHVITRNAFQATVHHQPNTFDGQTGFGNIGRQHHLAAPGRRRLNRLLLLRQR
ncbi:hypothetical protein D3C76_1376320 [compost metagenome]